MCLINVSIIGLVNTKSTDAMKIGINNEYPTAEKLSKEDFLIEFYDVGLLQSKNYPFLGVLPDGIVKI